MTEFELATVIRLKDEFTAQFDKTMDNIVQKMAQVPKSTEEAAGKTVSAVDRIRNSWQMVSMGINSMVSLYQQAMATIKRATADVEEGARLIRLEGAFKSVTEAAGVMGDEFLENMQRVTKYTIDQSDLMERTMRGIREGMDPAKMVEMAAMVKAQSKVVGESGAEAIQRFTNAITIGQVRALRAYLGYIDLNKVLSEFAQKQETTADRLNETGRMTAILDAVLVKLKSRMTETGNETTSMTDKFSQAKAAYQDFWEEIQKSLAKSWFGQAIVGLGAFVAELNRAKKTGEETVDLQKGAIATFGMPPGIVTSKQMDVLIARYKELLDKEKEMRKAAMADGAADAKNYYDELTDIQVREYEKMYVGTIRNLELKNKRTLELEEMGLREKVKGNEKAENWVTMYIKGKAREQQEAIFQANENIKISVIQAMGYEEEAIRRRYDIEIKMAEKTGKSVALLKAQRDEEIRQLSIRKAGEIAKKVMEGYMDAETQLVEFSENKVEEREKNRLNSVVNALRSIQEAERNSEEYFANLHKDQMTLDIIAVKKAADETLKIEEQNYAKELISFQEFNRRKEEIERGVGRRITAIRASYREQYSDELDEEIRELTSKTLADIDKAAQAEISALEHIFNSTGKMGEKWLANRRKQISEEIHWLEKAGMSEEEIKRITDRKKQELDVEYYNGLTKNSDDFFLGLEASYKEAVLNHKTWAMESKNIYGDTFDFFKSEMDTFVDDVWAGKLKTAEDYFISFSKNMLKIFTDMLIKMAAQEAAMGFTKGLGSIGNIWNMYSVSKQTGPVYTGEGGFSTQDLSGVSPHGGGYIPSSGRYPKYHWGGEVPAILQRGEYVVRKEAVNSDTLPILRNINANRYHDGGLIGRGGGNEGGKTEIHIHAIDAPSFIGLLAKNRDALSPLMVSLMRNNKEIGRFMKGQY